MREAEVRDVSEREGSPEPRKLETAGNGVPSPRRSPRDARGNTTVGVFGLLRPIFGARSCRTVK